MKKLLLPMLCAGVMCGNAWAGVVPGEGTAANPYVITTAADWNAVADDMDKQYDAGVDTLYPGAVFKLAADIDFAGVAMKPWALNMPFDGVLDGGNFTMKGYSINAGKTPYFAPIGWMGPNSEVKNITMAGSVASDTTYVGGVAGSCEGKISNVIFAGKVTTPYQSAGGIVALGAYYSRYNNCVNRGTVEAYQGYVGGIIGHGYYGLECDGCVNEGVVSFTGPSNAALNYSGYIGGIIGYGAPSTFRNCVNDGEVKGSTAQYVAGIMGYGKPESTPAGGENYRFGFYNCVNNKDIYGMTYPAGILGAVVGNIAVSMTDMEGCHNHGNITCTYAGKSSNTGGVAGVANVLKKNSVYRDCTNTGNITAVNCSYVGGVFGGTVSAASATERSKVVNCHNSGTITVTRSADHTTPYLITCGGVASTVNAFIDVDSCSNTGNITFPGYNVGGIAGGFTSNNQATSSISNSYNTGNITSTLLGKVGGIVGTLSGWAAHVENCWNSGNIMTTNTIPGTAVTTSCYAIGGIAGDASCQLISNCYNVGTIQGASRVGGILGSTTTKRGALLNCYNAGQIIVLRSENLGLTEDGKATIWGDVKFENDSCGSLVGTATVGNPKAWSPADGNTMINCYYVTDYGTYANDVNGGEESGTPVAMAQLCKTEISDAFTSPGDNCMPVLTQFAKAQNAQFYSAAVVPATGDTYAKITKDFSVGTPDGTVWSASNPAVAFNGNAVHLADFIDEDVVLTAKLGDLSKEVKVHITGGTSGIDAVCGDAAAEVVAERWYGMDGRAMAAPASADGSAYVVVQKLADGTTRTVKVVNK